MELLKLREEEGGPKMMEGLGSRFSFIFLMVIGLFLLSGCPSRTHVRRRSFGVKDEKSRIVKPKRRVMKKEDKEKKDLLKQPKKERSIEKATLRHIPFPQEAAFKRALKEELEKKWFYRTILARRSLYQDVIWPILEKYRVSKNLIYIAGIESAYTPWARSYAKAVGIWQFIPGTARRYGLKIDIWRDERRHVAKETVAAAKYLRFLFEKFGNWEFAIASYNCGEGRVERIIKRCPNMSFWQMREQGGCGLPLQTRDYVLRFFTLYYVAQQKKPFGKRIRFREPKIYKEIFVKEPLNLLELAHHLDVNIRDIWSWNPEIYHSWVTPPVKSYPLLVPPNKEQKVRRFLRRPRKIRLLVKFIRHDRDLKRWARRYRLKASLLRSLNHRCIVKKRSQRMRIYRKGAGKIIIPLPFHHRRWRKRERNILTSFVGKFRKNKWLARYVSCLRKTRKRLPCHIVHEGDSYWFIGKRYGISYRDLMRWNRGGRRGIVHAGQLIRLTNKGRCYWCSKRGHRKVCFKENSRRRALKARSGGQIRCIRHYKVRGGDTLFKLSKRYGVSLDTLKRWNHLKSGRIYRGQRLCVKVTLIRRERPRRRIRCIRHYKVRGGDTLFKLSRRYGISLQQLKIWNHLKSGRIYRGQRLCVKVALIRRERPRRRIRCIRHYKVRGGDTLLKLSKRYGISLDTLKSWNHLRGETIYRGQRLCVKVKALRRRRRRRR